MTLTIRDELAAGPFGPANHLSTLVKLGIDPDLPAEWATVDRCLTWLSERELWADIEAGLGNCLVSIFGDNRDRRADATASTLHAALIAACQAVKEVQP